MAEGTGWNGLEELKVIQKRIEELSDKSNPKNLSILEDKKGKKLSPKNLSHIRKLKKRAAQIHATRILYGLENKDEYEDIIKHGAKNEKSD